MLAGTSILILDDNAAIRQLVERLLGEAGAQVYAAGSLGEGREILTRSAVDLVFLDLLLPDGNGLAFLADLRREYPEMPVVIITGHGTVERAVEAMKVGAFDFLRKPFEHVDLIRITAEKALEQRRVLRENRDLKREMSSRFALDKMVGQSPAMQRVFKIVRQLSDSEATVLIEGESGTGKDLLAQAIHYQSPRAKKRFMPVDCGALPESLIESELFGHLKGTFTGAYRDHLGLFREADGGTIFLDEIGELPSNLQAKLLRVLQEREVRPLGSSQSIPVDVRVIAATNRDLKEAVRQGVFREDLFYRLNVIQFRLPPLRERPEDIPLLVEHFLAEHRRRTGNAFRFRPDALKLIAAGRFAGNVRELQNLVEQTLATATGPEVGADQLPADFLQAASNPAELPLDFDAYEKLAILRALETFDSDVEAAAEALKVGVSTLYRKMKRHGIPHPRAARKGKP